MQRLFKNKIFDIFASCLLPGALFAAYLAALMSLPILNAGAFGFGSSSQIVKNLVALSPHLALNSLGLLSAIISLAYFNKPTALAGTRDLGEALPARDITEAAGTTKP